MKDLPFAMAVLKTDRKVTEDGTALRGFTASRLRDNPLAHQHLDGSLVYTYPRVQYKVIDGAPIIWGIAEASRIIPSLVDGIEHMTLGKSRYEVIDVEVREATVSLGEVSQPIAYGFVTPWLALNQENYSLFKTMMDWRERKQLLNQILVGNTLSMAKGLRLVVGKRLMVRTRLDPVKVIYKGVPHLGFLGDFQMNYRLPPLIGLGKGVSRGFGCVMVRPNSIIA